MSIFSKDFFPTPEEVISQMLYRYNLDGKVILEPSAGSGNIVDYLNSHYTPKQVLACEISPQLRSILTKKKCSLIGEDFLELTAEKVSHVDYIVMNPPFSADEKHILHAFEIAPPQSQIISLCNSNVIELSNSLRDSVKALVKNYGYTEDLGTCFDNAERKTNVKVSLVVLTKPGQQSEDYFDGFFDSDNDDDDAQIGGLIKYNVLRDAVNRYVGAMKIFDKQMESAVELNRLTSHLRLESNFCFRIEHEKQELSRLAFQKHLLKNSWSFIFDKANLHRTLTTSLQVDLNKFVENQVHVPFTVRNISRMLDIVIGTHASRMDKTVLEIFEKITRHSKDNIWNVEGWVSNSNYMITQRVIVPERIEMDFQGRPRLSYSGRWDFINDFHKVWCYLSGNIYKYEDRIDQVLSTTRFGEKFQWLEFTCKVYKKGTLHIYFTEEQQALINRKIAELVGFALPKETKARPKASKKGGVNGK